MYQLTQATYSAPRLYTVRGYSNRNVRDQCSSIVVNPIHQLRRFQRKYFCGCQLQFQRKMCARIYLEQRILRAGGTGSAELHNAAQAQ